MGSESNAPVNALSRGLFLGELHDESFHPFPEQEPDEREKADLTVEAFRDWAKDNLDPVQIDREQEIPAAVREGLAEMGLLGMTIPEEYGGYGFGATSYCRVMEEVTRADASLSVFIGAHLSIGAKPIVLFGSEALKRAFLPAVATGEKLCAFALTEPGAGSDAGSLRTNAVWDESKNAFRLNGNKIWITNGGYAQLFSVFARATGGPITGDEGITAFLLERGQPGFTNGPSEHKLGIRGSSTTELAFQDVLVQPERIIGKPGEGFYIATHSLETGRLSLGAGCTGACKELIRLAARHARERTQFRKPIIEFGMVREKLGRMAATTYGSESMVYLTSGRADRGADVFVEAGFCKVFGSETLWTTVNDAVQIAGGIGYMTEYPYERHLRDSRINLIFEGTNEILRLASTLEALKEPGRRVTEALRAAKSGIGAAGVEAALAAESRPAVAGPPPWVPAPLAAQGDVFAATQKLFADAVLAVMRKHRRAILGQEYTLRRLADAAIRLYAMAATLARAASKIAARGTDGAPRDILLASRFIDDSHRVVRRELEDMDVLADRLDDDIADLLREEGRYPTPLH